MLAAGFTGVAAWMLVDQYVLGHLATHVSEYMQEAGTFFKSRNESRHGCQRDNGPHAVIGGLIVAMLVVLVGVARALRVHAAAGGGPGPCRCFSSSPTRAGSGSSATTCIPWGAFTVKPFMPTVFGEGP